MAKDDETQTESATFDSTCLRSGNFEYDKDGGVLTVTMRGHGKHPKQHTYSYEMTPRQFRYLRDEAPSPGGYFNRKLKGNEI